MRSDLVVKQNQMDKLERMLLVLLLLSNADGIIILIFVKRIIDLDITTRIGMPLCTITLIPFFYPYKDVNLYQDI